MRISVVLLLLVTLAGCAGLNTGVDEQQAKLNEIVALNQQAEAAINNDRLTKPVANNAYHYYQQVLVLDNNNLQARQGLKAIAEAYAVQATHAANEGRIEDYRYDLSWVEKITPNSERLAELKALDPNKRGSNIWLIKRSDLKARNRFARNQIQQAAIIAKRYQSRVKIVAPNDADGRWIYQQMRNYADDYLFRSSLIVGDSAKIVALDAPSR